MNPSFWHGKRVFLTGHTGFKGGWLTLWLEALGAQVYGFALPPPTEPNLFTEARVGQKLTGNTLGDLSDRALLAAALHIAKPEIILHLAAQALVRHAYAHPVETYATNVMGTVHLLEAIRACPSVRALINVTTDKCYENQDWTWGYREIDPLGGADPYSSSKACSELITAAYRRSFFDPAQLGVATARAGNVIGGGDWAPDRLIPDAFRSLDSNTPLEIRAPHSIRPWQHVLEPLSGYLTLAENLYHDAAGFSGAWNFGPSDDGARSVEWILEHLSRLESDLHWVKDTSPHPHEASTLTLDSSLSRQKLGWHPRWKLETALEKTMDWHQAWRLGADMAAFTLEQIRSHSEIPSDTTRPA